MRIYIYIYIYIYCGCSCINARYCLVARVRCTVTKLNTQYSAPLIISCHQISLLELQILTRIRIFYVKCLSRLVADVHVCVCVCVSPRMLIAYSEKVVIHNYSELTVGIKPIICYSIPKTDIWFFFKRPIHACTIKNNAFVYTSIWNWSCWHGMHIKLIWIKGNFCYHYRNFYTHFYRVTQVYGYIQFNLSKGMCTEGLPVTNILYVLQ